jgi:serine/threonine protein kinase
MSAVKSPDLEPLPGYRLLEPLGKGGFGEVWKCEAPGGLNKAVKFVYGSTHIVDAGSAGVEQELRALEHIRSIRHPFLLSMDRIEIVDGELIIIMELADQSLHDYYQQCRNAGLPGIPRNDLLNNLQEAAEALDLINIRYGLQHLDIKPRNLLLVSSHIKVADFGLVSSLAEAETATRQQLAAISPIYASPEVFQGTFSPTSDQYSLAMAYFELLTGELPFTGKNYRQLALAHLQAEPNLQALQESDRAGVARALSKDPSKRFPSCSDFIQALLTAQLPSAPVAPSARLRWQSETALLSGAALPGEETKTPMHPKADVEDDLAFPERARAMRHLTTSPAALSEYQFQECLDRSELSEMWMAQAPGVGPCIVKFMYGLSDLDATMRNDAVQRMAALSHPALVPSALARSDPSRLVLVTPRLGPTLRERWQKAKNDGAAGIPRSELLGILRDAAQTLDVVAEQYRVAHLSLNPDNLQLVQGRTLIADHGLASFFWLAAGQPLAAGNARYAPAELWGNAISRACDSYSLAVIYQEMLTGKHPFAAAGTKNQARMMAKADLLPLPERDRAVMQQALDRTPSRRFATCADLIAALETTGTPNGNNGSSSPVAKSSRPESDVEFSLAPVARLLHDIIACASNGCLLQEHGTFRYLLQPGQLVRHSFVAPVVPRTLALMLEPFVQQWQAQLFDQGDEMLAYRLPFPGDGRASMKTRTQGLEVHLHLRQRPTLPPPLVEVRIHIKPFGCSALAADIPLRQTGPALLESLRGVLQAHPERRAQDRLPYEEAVTVWPLDKNGVEQMPIRGQGKDLSRSGLGLYLPRRPPSEELRLFLSQNGRPVPVPVSARVVRVETRGDRVEVGTMFSFDSEPTA